MIKPWMVYRLFKTLNLLFIFGTVLFLAAMARLLWLEHSERTAVLPTPEILSAAPKNQISEEFPPVFSRQVSKDVEIVNASEAGIEFKGILSYPGHDYAIIQYRGKQKLVRTGDKIGSWAVAEISGEVLKAVKKGKKLVLKPSHRVSESRVHVLDQKKILSPVLPKSNEPVENKIAIEEKVFRKWMNNWADVFREIQIMPYVEKGKSKGYVLCYLRPDSMMQKLGFRNGDIIEKINDREVTNLQTLLALYDFVDTGDCRVEIKRGPKRMQMVYQIVKSKI